MKLLFLVPHFAPDVAPTGDVATRIVSELAARGHSIEVLTALPWYRLHKIEPEYSGKLVRREDTPWGSITRLHPFPSSDKQNIPRRALSYAGFTALSSWVGSRGPDVDAVLALSPPLTLGLAGRRVAKARNAPFVFNIQDVFPDIAVELGALTNKRLIGAALKLEKFCYERADAITVLSDDLKDNVVAKLGISEKVHVIPNFVDTEWITPMERENAYRAEYGLTDKTVVMYAGNVGLSQSLDMVLEAAGALAYETDVVFVINGQGAKRDELERHARGLANVRFVDMQPSHRLPELLAAADIHLVPLKRGLARSSVPSKTYSILAAGRPLVASVDPGSEVARLIERSGAGVSIPPEDSEALTKTLRQMIDSPDELEVMGRSGRSFIEGWASPRAVAEAYEELFLSLGVRAK